MRITRKLGSAKLSPKMLEDIYLGKEVFTVQPTPKGDAVIGVVPVFSYAVPTEVIGAWR